PYSPAHSIRSLTIASRPLEPFYDLLMAQDPAFSLLFQPFANQRVLIGVQFDVVGDRLVNEITARTVLRGGQRIKSVDLFSDGTETDGLFIVSHNARRITQITPHYHRQLAQYAR